MPGLVYQLLADDHTRLADLLRQASVRPEALDQAAYAEFRAGLLKHISMEEKVLFPAAQHARDGQPLPVAAKLRFDHGALATFETIPNRGQNEKRVRQGKGRRKQNDGLPPSPVLPSPTMAQDPAPEVYLLYIWIRHITPLIWRRVLVRADDTLADLHYIIQIAFSWTDFHLHRFRFRKKDFAIPRVEGFVDAHDAREVTLGALRFRLNERFLYEYDFGDQWEHEVRVEKLLPIEARRKYPVCIGGQRAGPPEDCGGPQAYDDRRREAPWRVEDILDQLREALRAEDEDAVWDRVEALRPWREWLALDTFDRRTVNRRLRQYGAGDDDWRWE